MQNHFDQKLDQQTFPHSFKIYDHKSTPQLKGSGAPLKADPYAGQYASAVKVKPAAFAKV